MFWIEEKMNLKINIEETKKKYEGPQMASSKLALDFGWYKHVCVIFCDHFRLDLVLKSSSVK